MQIVGALFAACRALQHHEQQSLGRQVIAGKPSVSCRNLFPRAIRQELTAVCARSQLKNPRRLPNLTTTTRSYHCDPARPTDAEEPHLEQPEQLAEHEDSDMPTSTISSGTKRKRTTGPAFYVVKAGHNPGIYMNWSEVQEQTKGFSNSIQKKFTTLTEAEAWFKGDTTSSTSNPTKWYAVQVGRTPGVYTDWQQVLPQITGWKKAKHKSFPTEEEAWAFVNAGTEPTPGADFGIADLESELLTSGTGIGGKVGSSVSKKQKKNDGAAAVTVLDDYDYELGTGPLPYDAEDGFDRTIRFNPVNGTIEPKTEEQLNARKWQQTGEYTGPIVIYTDGSALGNGKVGAVAGVGVYFGNEDPRFVTSSRV
jgi:ribonuclease HI